MRLTDSGIIKENLPKNVCLEKTPFGNTYFSIMDCCDDIWTDRVFVVFPEKYCIQKNTKTVGFAVYYDRNNLTPSLMFALSHFRKSDELQNEIVYKTYVKSKKYKKAVSALNEYAEFAINLCWHWKDVPKYQFVKYPKQFAPVLRHLTNPSQPTECFEELPL